MGWTTRLRAGCALLLCLTAWGLTRAASRQEGSAPPSPLGPSESAACQPEWNAEQAQSNAHLPALNVDQTPPNADQPPSNAQQPPSSAKEPGLSDKKAGPASARLNLLVVTIDTLRADHLGCYGYFRDTSPTIDALARDSTLFTRCLVPVAQTLPSHLSLMTGVYPLEHGVISNLEKPGGQNYSSTPQLRTLAEFLHEQGYRTAGFVSATPLKRESGIASGFDHFSQPDHARRLGAETTEAALEWLGEKPAEPFFAWVHYFDPHAPYDAPSPYDRQFTTDEKLEAHLTQRQVPARVQKQRSDKRVVPEEDAWDTRKAVNGYDGEIRYTDEQVRTLLARLREAGLNERTLIVLTGDHGEGLGQHGIVMHDAIWDEQLHVPLIIHVPGRSAQRVTAAMRSIDILPTVLALMPGLPAAPFIQQCRGSNALNRTEPVDLFAQEPQGRRDARTLVSGEWKLVVEDKVARLFHLPTDPFELKDVAKEKPEVAAQLKQRLTELVEGQITAAKRYLAARPAAPGASDGAKDAKRREELHGLGYLESDDEEEAESDSKKKKPSRGSP